MKNFFSVLLRVTISFGLLGLLFWLMRDDIRNIWSTICSSNIKILVIAGIVFFVNNIMLAWRLKIIFLGENIKISLKESFQLTLIGYFFNNFMPTAVGGDLVKAHYAAKFNKKSIKSYASVLMDRFIGLYTFLVIAAVALIVDGGRFNLKSVRVLIFCLLFIGLAGFVIVMNKTVARLMGQLFLKIKISRIGERLNELYNIVHDYRNRLDVVVKAFLTSMCAQCLYFLVIYLFFFSLGVKISPGNIFLIMPVVTFISMIPSIGGLGVREGAIVTFFAPLAGKETAFAVSLLLLLGLLIISFAGGIIYLWWGIKKRV